MSDMAVCSICGKEYRACLSCKEKMKIMPWKRLTDTEECYKIFLTLQSYTNKNTTKEEARSALEKVKFNKEELKPHIQAAIDEIFAKDESSKQEDKPPKDEVPEELPKEEKVPEDENKVATKQTLANEPQPQKFQPQQTQPKGQTQKSQGAQPKKSSKYYKKGKKR